MIDKFILCLNSRCNDFPEIIMNPYFSKYLVHLLCSLNDIYHINHAIMLILTLSGFGQMKFAFQSKNEMVLFTQDTELQQKHITSFITCRQNWSNLKCILHTISRISSRAGYIAQQQNGRVIINIFTYSINPITASSPWDLKKQSQPQHAAICSTS